MKVKSKKGSKKIVKGMVYDTKFFANDPKSTMGNSFRNRYGRILIEGYGMYRCADFTTTYGKPLPQIDFDERLKNYVEFKAEDTKKGDIVVCQSDRYKYLIKGAKYRVEDVKIHQHGNTGTYVYQTTEMKLEGYKRWLSCNNWTFRRLNTQEYRDLALSQIFDKEENFSVDFIRKFDKSKNPDKILIETIAKSILDKYRHELDIVQWGIEKNSTTYDLHKEDFDHLLDISLRDILTIIENQTK